VQRRVVAHVGEPPLPVQHPLQIPDRVRDSSVRDVDELSALPPHVYDHRPDGTDTERSLVRRLASPARKEGRTVEYHLTAFQLYHAGLELLGVGVSRKQLLGHSGKVPRSWFLNVTTSR